MIPLFNKGELFKNKKKCKKINILQERKKRKSECENGLEPEAPQPTYSRFTSGRITIDRRRLPLLVGCIGTDCV